MKNCSIFKTNVLEDKIKKLEQENIKLKKENETLKQTQKKVKKVVKFVKLKFDEQSDNIVKLELSCSQEKHANKKEKLNFLDY